MRFTLVCVLLGGAGAATMLEAQQSGWGLTAEVGLAGFGGHGHGADSITPDASAHPGGSMTLGFRIDRSTPRVRFAAGVRIASTGVEFATEDLSVETKHVLNLLEIAPEIGVVVLRREESAVLLHGGIVIDRWSPEGGEVRTRVGAGAGATFEASLFSRIALQARYDTAIGGSVFDEGELPPGFERKTGWQQQWSLGLRYRL